MKIRTTIFALMLALSLIALACTKSGGGSVATMSDEDKHKLLQAASASQDHSLFLEVLQKLGLATADGKPAPGFTDFMKAQMVWIRDNTAWVSQYNDPQKAKEYVKSHMPQ